MSFNLRILLILFSIFLTFIIIKLIKKELLPIKYSLFWIAAVILIFLVGLVPNFINIFTSLIGFETTSNLTIGIILVIVLFITLLLTLIVSKQKKMINLLIQEISILKKEIDKKN